MFLEPLGVGNPGAERLGGAIANGVLYDRQGKARAADVV